MSSMRKQKLLGIEVSIPEDWTDISLYRFAVPASEGEAAPSAGPLSLASQSATSSGQFVTNLVVSRTPLKPGSRRDETVFDDMNRGQGGNPSYRVLGRGTTTVDGRPAAWQDCTFTVPEARIQLYQRQAVVFVDPGQAVSFSVTSKKPDLGEHFAALGIHC